MEIRIAENWERIVVILGLLATAGIAANSVTSNALNESRVASLDSQVRQLQSTVEEQAAIIEGTQMAAAMCFSDDVRMDNNPFIVNSSGSPRTTTLSVFGAHLAITGKWPNQIITITKGTAK